MDDKTTEQTPDGTCPLPKMVVGVMGSSGGAMSSEITRKAFELGREIARRCYVLVTGACPGLPQEAVNGASSLGGIVIGISPALNLEEHITKFSSPFRGYNAMVYTGSGLMGREIENIRSCDVVVFAGGRSGTLGEFAIAYDEGKIIGLLEGTDGITEHLKTIISFVKKETGAVVVSSPDPVELLDLLEEVYETYLAPRYRALMLTHDPEGVATH